ncbi:hypothetical protein [Mesorhizobium sp. M0019]
MAEYFRAALWLGEVPNVAVRDDYKFLEVRARHRLKGFLPQPLVQ